MTENLAKPCSAFDGNRILASGPLVEVALAVRNAADAGAAGPILVFDDTTGRVVDLDLRGTKADIVARLSESTGERPKPRRGTAAATEQGEPRRRGRPKLGVVGREVTLLPRHWDWLSAQPGGASVALRKLVEEARRSGATAHDRRLAQEAAYRFMSAIAGDLPGFEEATRALFANDRALFEWRVSPWPADVRGYAIRLAFDGASEEQP